MKIILTSYLGNKDLFSGMNRVLVDINVYGAKY